MIGGHFTINKFVSVEPGYDQRRLSLTLRLSRQKLLMHVALISMLDSSYINAVALMLTRMTTDGSDIDRARALLKSRPLGQRLCRTNIF